MIARILVVLVFISAVASPARADRLIFLNGDRITGKLHGMDGSGKLLWAASGDAAPLAIPLAAVHKVELPAASGSEADAATAARRNASVTLGNGDFLHGNLLGLGAASVTLASPDFGTVEIPRTMITDLDVSKDGYYLLAEPGKSKDWFVDRRGSWKVSNGVLKASDYGVLGRGLPRASRIRIDFDVTTEDAGAGFTVHFFATNEQTPAREAGYAVQFSGAYVYARKTVVNKAAGGGGLFGRGMEINQESLGEPKRLDQAPGVTPMRVSILADARGGTIVLMVNNTEVQTWNDPRAFGEDHGTAIGFASNSKNTEIRNLTVVRWNGVLADKRDGTDATRTPDQDTVLTANDDRLVGKVTGVRDNAIVIETEHFGELALPGERVLGVQLASASREQARRMDGDVHLLLRHGGKLTLKLLELTPAKLVGTSENTGRVEVDRNAISALTFNLYSEKFPNPDAIQPNKPQELLLPDW